jgi:DNA polymerase-1
MIKATTADAYKLFHEGTQALSRVESNGICVDTDYLHKVIDETTQKIKQLTEDLKSSKIHKRWRKRFGRNMNLESADQLGKILFEDFQYPCSARTKTGKPKTDISALEQLNIPFVKKYLQIKKLQKARSTYLKGILSETTNGFLHCFFDLHTVQTYRSSSSKVNWQNMPIRNKEMGKLIRQCFIPRTPDGQIVEVDYGGIEVHAASWYHKDPVMLDYIHDKTKDMHRDMAQQCYALPKSEMRAKDKADALRIKDIRYCGKNKFVFPEFYGDWYFSCAPSLWNSIDLMHLTTRDGRSLKEHLKIKGIIQLGNTNNYKAPPSHDSFVYHIKEVEYDFWNKRFKIYKKWKDDWYNAYRKTGQFTMLTGFTVSDIMKRNEVINYPVQGVAFHCLLWSLIRIQKLLKKYQMRSLIIGQIHDSIVADVIHKELKTYLELVNQVMTVDIKKHWKWIITPLEIEAEVAPVGKSWFEKAKYTL